MALILLLSVAACATLVIYHVHTYIRQAAKAKSLGCEPAPLFRPWDALGLQNFKIEMNGMKTNRLSYAFLDRKNEMSAYVGRETKTFRIKYPVRNPYVQDLRRFTGRISNYICCAGAIRAVSHSCSMPVCLEIRLLVRLY